MCNQVCTRSFVHDITVRAVILSLSVVPFLGREVPSRGQSGRGRGALEVQTQRWA